MDDWVETTPTLAHTPIIQKAARYANEILVVREDFPTIHSGNAVFAEINRAPIDSQRFRLTLTQTGQTLPPEQREKLPAIAAEAVRKAVLDEGPAFVGLLLGYGRKGINYFDRYKA